MLTFEGKKAVSSGFTNASSDFKSLEDHLFFSTIYSAFAKELNSCSYLIAKDSTKWSYYFLNKYLKKGLFETIRRRKIRRKIEIGAILLKIFYEYGFLP